MAHWSSRRVVWVVCCLLWASAVEAEPTRVVSVDAASNQGPLSPSWAWFETERARATLHPDGARLLEEIAQLGAGPKYIRAHNLLTSGEGPASLRVSSTQVYAEDKSGKPLYRWETVDRIVDAYVRLGLIPVMEMGFMPQALSTHPKPYFHDWNKTGELFAGWAYPPTSYKKWGALISQWVKHSIERYGRKQVETWLWQPWNEPDSGAWQGSFNEFVVLYDHSVEAVKSACPRCKVGGPHTTNPNTPRARAALREFLEHCDTGVNAATGKRGAPLDFIAFHATGEPTVVGRHVQMNLGVQLQAVEAGFETVGSFPKFQRLPVLVGAFDPDSCAACSPRDKPAYSYRLATRYPAYLATSQWHVRAMARERGVNLLGIVTGSFHFENQRYFDGFRDLATHGIHKPVWALFEMLAKMPQKKQLEVQISGALSTSQIMVQGVVGKVSEIQALASRGKKQLAILVWNYHDKDISHAPQDVLVSVNNLGFSSVEISHYRLDETHSNARVAWQKMGSPQTPTIAQQRDLQAAAQLAEFGPKKESKPVGKPRPNGRSKPALQPVIVAFPLPTHAVSLLILTDSSGS